MNNALRERYPHSKGKIWLVQHCAAISAIAGLLFYAYTMIITGMSDGQNVQGKMSGSHVAVVLFGFVARTSSDSQPGWPTTFAGTSTAREKTPFIPSEPVWPTPELLLLAPFEHNADGWRGMARYGYRSITDHLACLGDVSRWRRLATGARRCSRPSAQVTHAPKRCDSIAFADDASKALNIHRDARGMERGHLQCSTSSY